MTSAELAIFNTFFIDTLEDGTLPFNWIHPTRSLIFSWWFDSKQSPRLGRMTPDTFRVSINLLRFGSGAGIRVARVRMNGVGNLSVGMHQNMAAMITPATFLGPYPQIMAHGNMSVNTRQVHMVQVRFAGAGKLRTIANLPGQTDTVDDAFQQSAFQRDAFQVI
jgi:hypothetical protein